MNRKGDSVSMHINRQTNDRRVAPEDIDAAVKRVQSLVRQYVPEGVSLADELIAERRAAAEVE
ncbi:hypothetical protein [Niveispirillum sp. KHB5.9]|uniref:hypothetical protein n=1 Tax=Niveispirillum sp. KHB5.9 TaxID=3400269 RepID=UPI003A85178F